MKEIINTFKFYCIETSNDKLKFSFLIVLTVFSHLFEIGSLGVLALYFVTISGNINNNNLDILNNITNLNLSDIRIFSIMMIVIIFSKFFIQISVNYYKYYLITGKYNSFQRKLMKIFLGSDYNIYKNFSSEQISKYINYDIERVYFNYITNIVNLISEIIFFILIILAIGYNYSDQIDEVIIFFVVIFLLSIYILKKISLFLGKKQVTILSNLFSSTKNIFGSYIEIKIANIEKRVGDGFNKILDNYSKYFKVFAVYTSSIKYILEFLIVFSVLITILYLSGNEKLKLGINFDFALIGLLIIRAYPNFTRIQSFSAALLHMLPISNEIFKNISVILDNFTKNLRYSKIEKNLINANEDFNIELNNINFSYDKKLVLDNLNLKINKGDKICIFGDIGSGKSTVLKIILGLIKPDHGEFKINNKLIENSNLLKNLYSYVPQNPFFFNDSILNNLTYFQKGIVDREQVDETLKKYDFFNFFNKYNIENFIIGENGSNLSGGQRQIVALMRAILKNNQILILDEPTSSMDDRNSDKFFEIIEKFTDKTIVIVTHNQSIIEKFKTKYQMDNKKLTLLN